jgi:hypothetical protein
MARRAVEKKIYDGRQQVRVPQLTVRFNCEDAMIQHIKEHEPPTCAEACRGSEVAGENAVTTGGNIICDITATFFVGG